MSIKLPSWIKKAQSLLSVSTVAIGIGFIAVFAVWGGYAYLIRNKDFTTQASLQRELQELREENSAFIERIRLLEQQLASGPQQDYPKPSSPDATAATVKRELEQGRQRSFVYVVKKGDSVWNIAQKYNVDVQDVMRWNNLTKRSRIFPGDQLTIILNE